MAINKLLLLVFSVLLRAGQLSAQEPPSPTSSDIITIRIRFKLSNQNCSIYISDNVLDKVTNISSAIVSSILRSCFHSLENLTGPSLSCGGDQSEVIYQTESSLLGTECKTVSELIQLFQQWVESSPTILTRGDVLTVDPNCVDVDNIDKCIAVNSTLGQPNDDAMLYIPALIIITIIVTGLVVLIILLVVLLIILILTSRRRSIGPRPKSKKTIKTPRPRNRYRTLETPHEAISSPPAQPSSDLLTVFTEHVIVTSDTNGGTYSLEGCTLIIPEGAIPEDQVISIRMGVSICTDLMSCLPLGLQPVSPIVQLCVLGDPKFKFAKNVTVQITHCLDISTEEDVKEMNVHFLKSSHDQPGLFLTTDGCETFMTPHAPHQGTLSINHFCTFCIAAKKASIDEKKVWYYLMSVIPKQIVGQKWDVIFCVTLCTCKKVVEKQFSSKWYEVQEVKLFRFNSRKQYIKIHFKKKLASGWHLALQTDNKIHSRNVDYTQFEASILEDLERDRFYPPRYVISISGNNAKTSDTLKVNFKGSQEPFSTEVMLQQLPAVLPHPPLPPRKSVGVTSRLNITPTHCDLMNMVAARTPTIWREIGIQLGLSPSDLDLIEAHPTWDCNRCFSEVFSMWEEQRNMPYTWSTMVLALEAPLVEENCLAEEIKCTFDPRARRVSTITVGSGYSCASSGFGSLTTDQDSSAANLCTN